ncbi:MAG: electron transfer flavoprotein subunit alpha [candidate division WOR-3 bacterium]
MGIKITKEKCTGCGICFKVCKYGAVRIIEDPHLLENGKEVKKLGIIELEKCTLCGECVKPCPTSAIQIEREASEFKEKEEYRDVMIFAEQRRDQLESAAFELLGKGRELADKLGVKLYALLVGENPFNKPQELIRGGADVVIVVSHPSLFHFLAESYTNVLVDVIEKYKPSIFLAPSTTQGRSLLSRVASIIHTGLTADCTGLDVDSEGNLIQTRPAFGGSIMARILTPEKRPQMATVRPKVFKPLSPDPERKGEIIEEKISEEKLKSPTMFEEWIEDTTSNISVEDADIIISGGRGLGCKENFKLLFELADLLGGAVGASRPTVDEGWIPYSHQVGQTGKTVGPKMYIAVGISGAIQHLEGMRGSDFIVAINKDPEAPIFKIADIGIVGDLFEVLPVFKEKLKEALSG